MRCLARDLQVALRRTGFRAPDLETLLAGMIQGNSVVDANDPFADRRAGHLALDGWVAGVFRGVFRSG